MESGMTEKARNRHCWECRRRYLVCDFGQPLCRRCCRSGVDCPGYGDVKPKRLKWLPPGKIASRPQKHSGPLTTKENHGVVRQSMGSIGLARAIQMTAPRCAIDGCVLSEATNYYNSCIYQELAPLHELGPNPHVFQISPALLQRASRTPEYLQLGMICMTLSHRINRTRHVLETRALSRRYYENWGLALRSLSQHLDTSDVFTSEMVIAGIVTVLLTDIQHGASLDWKCHLDGVHRLIALRGGFGTVATSKSLEPVLLCLWSFTVIGNTTCPASDLTVTGLYLDNLDLLVQVFENAVTPIQMCPLPLFEEIVKINHIRSRAARANASELESLRQEAFHTSALIHSFSPVQWAGFRTGRADDWILLGNIYRSAAALYCVLSLESVSIFPQAPKVRAECANHAALMVRSLERASRSPTLKRFTIWPLVVLGVESVHGDQTMRAFVRRQLEELRRDIGIYLPLTAIHVLEAYWSSGVNGWDACFDKPYVFTSQIAVDTSRLLS